jgi:hypothetical protein
MLRDCSPNGYHKFSFSCCFKFHPKQSKIFILYSKTVIYWSSANFSCCRVNHLKCLMSQCLQNPCFFFNIGLGVGTAARKPPLVISMSLYFMKCLFSDSEILKRNRADSGMLVTWNLSHKQRLLFTKYLIHGQLLYIS